MVSWVPRAIPNLEGWVRKLEWKQNIDRLASEKDTAQAQLSSTERQLQNMKEEILARAKKIEELETHLAVELAKAISLCRKSKGQCGGGRGHLPSQR